MATGLESLGRLNAEQGKYDIALSLLEESLAKNQELGDKTHIAWVQGDIGIVALAAGDPLRSMNSTREALQLFRELGDKRAQSVASFILGAGMLYEAKYDGVIHHFRENILLCQTMGDDAGCAQGLEGLAAVAAARRAPELSAQLLGAAQRIRDDTSSPFRVRPVEQPLHDRHDRTTASATQSLGPEAFQLQYDRGHESPTADSIDRTLTVLGTKGGRRKREA